MVSVCVLVTPTVTLPKLTPDGMTEIAAGELVALLTPLMLPATAPAAAGEKLAVSERLWPAARVTPLENPLIVNPTPAAVA
jgi:hypothetical protein